jgi:hypothetical protein
VGTMRPVAMHHSIAGHVEGRETGFKAQRLPLEILRTNPNSSSRDIIFNQPNPFIVPTVCDRNQTFHSDCDWWTTL